MARLIAPSDVGHLVKNGSTVYCTGMGLAGFAEEVDAAGDRLLIDSHGAPVAEALWALFRQAVELAGPLPTLIERDQHVPPLPVLLAEARQAEGILRDVAHRRPAAWQEVA